MSEQNPVEARPAWFVGATYGGNDGQLPRFLREGIWENGYTDRYLDLVLAMQPGDRIAVKAAYTRKHGLPFDSRGHSTSVMSIKAVGTILENLQDGRHLRVRWQAVDPPREWYFFTNRSTIWKVEPGTWEVDDLLSFTFEGKPQNLDRFRNAPFWRERYGDAPSRFGWTRFYQAFADRLLDFRHRREELLTGIRALNVEGLGLLAGDRFSDGTTGFLRDICPFTTMGLFNRGLKDSNRRTLAAALGNLIGVTEPVPLTFEGIPLLNNQRSWLFPYEKDRPTDQIDRLWEVFARGLACADGGDESERDALVSAYDRASGLYAVGWNLSCGLYWARPWYFVTLDANSRSYIHGHLQLPILRTGNKKRIGGQDYLNLRDQLQARFLAKDCPVRSFPELSLESWGYTSPDKAPEVESEAEEVDVEEHPPQTSSYTVDDILRDGCFLERTALETMLERLRVKKNLILQGPPGTGKTWLARRLAFALVGQRDESRLRPVQFHPNLSYEDFVRGWRPSGDGRLSLVDGVFMEVVREAHRNPTSNYVVVIEEINRGNPAQIFGELLTLLEASKRNPQEALQLCYPDPESGQRRPVHIPPNLYVIGTMNLADRSLALVDVALRRRFAFVSLEPQFGEAWLEWVVAQGQVDPQLAPDIERRILELNLQIGADRRLGSQYRIGQSFVTPSTPLSIGGTRNWFLHVVETELQPLLEELWFDNPDTAIRAVQKLLQGW